MTVMMMYRQAAPALGVLLLLGATGCAGSPSSPSPVAVVYTVMEIPHAEEEPALFAVDVRFESEGTTLSSPRLTVLEGQWATITVANMKSDDAAATDLWQEGEDGPRISNTSEIDSGTFVAVRCTRAEKGLVHTQMRTYFVEGERSASREMARDLDPRETHRFEWTW